MQGPGSSPPDPYIHQLAAASLVAGEEDELVRPGPPFGVAGILLARPLHQDLHLPPNLLFVFRPRDPVLELNQSGDSLLLDPVRDLVQKGRRRCPPTG